MPLVVDLTGNVGLWSVTEDTPQVAWYSRARFPHQSRGGAWVQGEGNAFHGPYPIRRIPPSSS